MKTRPAVNRATILSACVVVLYAGAAIGADRAPIYNESADAKALIAAAVQKAKTNNKHVLIQWGGNWCGWCYKLHDLFESNDEIARTLQYEYEVVMIDSNTNEALAKSMKTKFEGVPYLTVLDSSGKKLIDQDTGSLEIGDKHDPAKVLAFLEKWKPAPLDANQVLSEATARAKQNGKAVFVDFSTVWCGWCRELEKYLHDADVARILEPHFEFVQIDQERMTNGEALRQRLSKGEGGGVPWFAFVDGDGDVIATSNAPSGNIGFPAEPSGTEHFLSMIEKAAPNITAEERERLAAPLRDFYASRVKEH